MEKTGGRGWGQSRVNAIPQRRFKMSKLLSTKEVAAFLKVNEKVVYSLISEKGLPATKVTGKWLFPRDLVEQWIQAGTVNYPESSARLPAYHGLVLIAGSNDLLLDKTVSFFNGRFKDHLAMFGFTGSMGGILALKKNLCHMASSHLVADNKEYNFPYIFENMDKTPAVINFCWREQGVLVKKGNPFDLKSVSDLGKQGVRVVNRGLNTGTRQLFDRKLAAAGLKGADITGYDHEVAKHADVGFEILSGKADAGPAIRPVARMLDLDFVPLCWERFDLIISKERFFDKGIQLFLGLVKDPFFRSAAEKLGGYDISTAGEIVYPEQPEASR